MKILLDVFFPLFQWNGDDDGGGGGSDLLQSHYCSRLAIFASDWDVTVWILIARRARSHKVNYLDMNVRGIFVTDPKQQRSSSQNNISKIKFFLKRINCALFLFIECAKCKAKHSECKSLAVLNGVADGIGLSVTQTLFLFSSYCQSVPRARNSINFFVSHFFYQWFAGWGSRHFGQGCYTRQRFAELVRRHN